MDAGKITAEDVIARQEGDFIEPSSWLRMLLHQIASYHFFDSFLGTWWCESDGI
jgi:hypothetical protein